LAGFARYGTMTNEGTLAVLGAAGATIDTVEAGFGVHQVGRDSIVFQPVRGAPSPDAESWHQLGQFTLYYQGRRSTLNQLLPYLHQCFSQPAIDGAVIYYWGLALGDTPRVYAARFSFASRSLDTLQLVGFDLPATDDCGFLPPPARDSSGFAFGEYRVSEDFRHAQRR